MGYPVSKEYVDQKFSELKDVDAYLTAIYDNSKNPTQLLSCDGCLYSVKPNIGTWYGIIPTSDNFEDALSRKNTPTTTDYKGYEGTSCIAYYVDEQRDLDNNISSYHWAAYYPVDSKKLILSVVYKVNEGLVDVRTVKSNKAYIDPEEKSTYYDKTWKSSCNLIPYLDKIPATLQDNQQIYDFKYTLSEKKLTLLDSFVSKTVYDDLVKQVEELEKKANN